MATAIGMIGGGSGSSWVQGKDSKRNKQRARVFCVHSSEDPYKTLKILRGASESEVKKAFRKLVLQYHPDVCRGSNCEVQFHRIKKAYEIVMSNLRGEPARSEMDTHGAGTDEPLNDYDRDWDTWEEWMGWEGGWVPDYSSHIHPDM
ncbi:Chaperone protein dnaJ 8 like [Actinidia chinensis var. chinensis]|uniref:Chaperone protein dnaJ 8 like n=1 Tax=Actinidia chinensis var. chinensis TaxID=1590841 RepID=A0A2R6PSD4_ACTCC|nr:Chaperone protein dnaJ 8 like [Actinidia chinensis var. chinensis]